MEQNQKTLRPISSNTSLAHKKLTNAGVRPFGDGDAEISGDEGFASGGDFDLLSAESDDENENKYKEQIERK